MSAAIATAAPWILIGGILIALIVYAVISKGRIERAKEDSEDATARARFNRKMADRTPAKDLDDLRARARRRRERE